MLPMRRTCVIIKVFLEKGMDMKALINMSLFLTALCILTNCKSSGHRSHLIDIEEIEAMGVGEEIEEFTLTTSEDEENNISKYSSFEATN